MPIKNPQTHKGWSLMRLIGGDRVGCAVRKREGQPKNGNFILSWWNFYRAIAMNKIENFEQQTEVFSVCSWLWLIAARLIPSLIIGTTRCGLGQSIEENLWLGHSKQFPEGIPLRLIYLYSIQILYIASGLQIHNTILKYSFSYWDFSLPSLILTFQPGYVILTLQEVHLLARNSVFLNQGLNHGT